MKNTLLILFSLLTAWSAFAQTDSVKMRKYSPGFRFYEGIYVSHHQLVNNNPVAKGRIISNFNPTDFDFFDKLLEESVLTYYDDYGFKKQVAVEDIWGFCRRGSVFINWNGNFYRIPVIGNVCHFVATVTVYDNHYSNPAYGNSYYGSPNSSTRTEVRQYLLEFETGKVVDYTHDNLEYLLMKSPSLYDEYHQLKKKKKKQMKFLYVRKLNDSIPIYIPVY